MWTEDNRTTCMMELVKNLHYALTEKCLKHYFITDCNFFDMENVETPHVLDSLAEKVEQFMSNPTKCLAEVIPGTRPYDVLSKYNEEATTKQKQNHGPHSFEGTLARIDSERRGQLATNNEERTYSSSQEEPSRRMSHTCTEEDAIGKKNSTEPATNSWQGARFHDLKDRYIHICFDLLTKAAEDGNVEELDQLERSLVENIRELINVYSFHPQKLLVQFVKRWQDTYVWLFTKCEFFTKQSLLAGIKNNVKLIRHMVLQHGCIGSPRDYSLVFPVNGLVNCHRRMQRILKSMEPKRLTAKKDDIPLD